MIKSIDKILIFTFFLSCISVFWLIPCTSFCIVHDGHAVFGTNLDFNFKSGMIVINRRNLHKRGFSAVNNKSWVSRYGSISVNLVGIEYVWSGMNEAGLIMSSMSLPETKLPKQDNKPKQINNLCPHRL